MFLLRIAAAAGLLAPACLAQVTPQYEIFVGGSSCVFTLAAVSLVSC
jgi:hypothetical protein